MVYFLKTMNVGYISTLVVLLIIASPSCNGFGLLQRPATSFGLSSAPKLNQGNVGILKMSDGGGGGGGQERAKSKKRGLTTITIEKQKVEEEEEEKDETEWRVLLHNDEVHTFEYVVDSLVKVIGTVDRKGAWDICVLTHGNGKATIVKAWKDQAEKYCLGLQRQGLTASIAPDNNFKAKGMDNDLGGGGDTE